MASKWNIAKYNRALKAIRKEHPGISIARARATWKNLSARLGKSASTVDVRKSALSKRGEKSSELSKAVRNSAAQTRRATANRPATEKRGQSKSVNTSAPSVRGKETQRAKQRGRNRKTSAPALTRIKSLSDWYAYYEDAEDFEDYDIAAGVDTGKSK